MSRFAPTAKDYLFPVLTMLKPRNPIDLGSGQTLSFKTTEAREFPLQLQRPPPKGLLL